MGGCLPMLLQMPIFLALWSMLNAVFELRHAPFFGWIVDLSARDPYFIFPVLMVSNLPANVMMRTFEPWMVFYVMTVGALMLVASHFVCNLALRWYRSASS